MLIPDLEKIRTGPPVDFDNSRFYASIHRGDNETLLGYLPDSISLYSIGWLGDQVPVTGAVPEECIAHLFEAYESGKSFSDGEREWHNCEICERDPVRYPDRGRWPVVRVRDREIRLSGHGHHLVQLGQKVYICPVLILHYILEHGYQPPQEFVTSVIEGSFLTADDLAVSTMSWDEWCAINFRIISEQ